MTTLHDFSLAALDGSERSLSDYSGKVALVVNVASKCGLTPQYQGLQELYDELGDRGLVVLGFPCNQFKGQEPGSEDEIRSFCTANYGVTFPMFSKIDVNGPDRHPLYAWLTQQDTKPEGPGDVQWNFGKFLVGRDGAVLARFEPPTEPGSADVRAAIEAAL
ncbi:MAG: glutathione peroxidase [Planctomycetota bacterium]